MEAFGNKKYDNLKYFRLNLASSLIKIQNHSKTGKSDFTDEQPAKKVKFLVSARSTVDI
jgi:hypothetical protein